MIFKTMSFLTQMRGGMLQQFRKVECKKCAINLQKSSSNNLYGKTSFLPNSKNKTTSVVVNRIHLPEPDYLICVDQLGNKVIPDCRYPSTEVVLSKNKVEIRLSHFQGSNFRVRPFHRALPDAKCYKAFSLNNCYKLFIFSFLNKS